VSPHDSLRPSMTPIDHFSTEIFILKSLPFRKLEKDPLHLHVAMKISVKTMTTTMTEFDRLIIFFIS
jgi:hypothetical protein